MNSKLGSIILVFASLVLASEVAQSTRGPRTESAESALNVVMQYEARLEKVGRRLEQVESPIQQMSPEAAAGYETTYNEMQLSYDDVSERLGMIRFVIDREGIAPNTRRDLAYTELNVLENDVRDLEEETSELVNEVDSVVWY